MNTKIAIGADHGGFDQKEQIKKQLDGMGIGYKDYGTFSSDSVDYPDIAQAVGEAVASGDAEQGILVCGSGIGISIAANKVEGVRAALVWNAETAALARQHNDANIMAIGGRTTPAEDIPKIVRAWFGAEFEGGRHSRRIDKITKLENGEAKATHNS